MMMIITRFILNQIFLLVFFIDGPQGFCCFGYLLNSHTIFLPGFLFQTFNFLKSFLAYWSSLSDRSIMIIVVVAVAAAIWRLRRRKSVFVFQNPEKWKWKSIDLVCLSFATKTKQNKKKNQWIFSSIVHTHTFREFRFASCWFFCFKTKTRDQKKINLENQKGNAFRQAHCACHFFWLEIRVCFWLNEWTEWKQS